MKKIKNLTQEDYKKLSQELNAFKRENLHPMEKAYARKELSKILPIGEWLVLNFLSKVGILESSSRRIIDWTDKDPIYVGKIIKALELFREYNLEKNVSVTKVRKGVFSVEDAIRLLLETGEYKIYKKKIEWVEV